uniref:Alpha-2-macroglobulin receptor-associated protein n=1 Tax=Caligus clemensi TaxID=344056 RepID=C1C100_CALCM|nr:Alpha-2-macroglobulin receptor-associated protein precursor [Caligus clemensi]
MKVTFFPLLIAMVVSGEESSLSYSNLESPFRMTKLNLLWEKVRRSQHLRHDSKMKAFYNALRLQEKEELALKKLKAEGKDKEGSFEDVVRKKFKNILEEFSLRHLSENEVRANTQKSKSDGPFGDKKLVKLWDKARNLGLKDEELHAFKAELRQYEEETKEYESLLKEAHSESLKSSNSIHSEEESQLSSHLADKRRQLKANLEALQMTLINSVPALDEEFSHPEVQDLWRFALDGNFSTDELEGLVKKELRVYEKRLNKVKHLEEELKLVDERHGGKYNEFHDASEGRKILDNKLKKHAEAIDELRKQIKHLILTRHFEL